MNYLHSEACIGPDNCFLVSLSSQANVMLLDDCNYQNYRAGRRYNYRGGVAKRSPVRMQPPRLGNWHLVIDIGGYAGNVRANVEVI